MARRMQFGVGAAAQRIGALRSAAALSMAFTASAIPALAGEPVPQPQTPATIIEASPDVSIGGVGAARQGDTTSVGQPVVTGSPNVFINGKPAAISGSVTGCNGVVVGSGANVFINGKPAARLGDQANCPAR